MKVDHVLLFPTSSEEKKRNKTHQHGTAPQWLFTRYLQTFPPCSKSYFSFGDKPNQFLAFHHCNTTNSLSHSLKWKKRERFLTVMALFFWTVIWVHPQHYKSFMNLILLDFSLPVFLIITLNKELVGWHAQKVQPALLKEEQVYWGLVLLLELLEATLQQTWIYPWVFWVLELRIKVHYRR